VSVPRGRKTEGGSSDPPTASEIVHGVRAKPTFETARDICAEATRLVGGDRAASHGDKRANFQNIACLWNSWLSMTRATRGIEATYLSARDVGDLMELLKIARRHSGSYNPDDYIDAAGYAGCTGEIAAADEATHNGTD
jgi:hypothetical protein